MKISARAIAISIFSFFLLLMCWSISSPIGSGVDTDYHLASIWCANGFREDICIEPDEGVVQSEPRNTALVPYMFQMCDERNIYFWPNCEIESSHPDIQELRMASPENLGLYYRITNVFASSNVSQSVLMIRIFNSLISSLVLALAFKCCTKRVKFALFSSLTFTLVPYGIQVLPGVNPRSWAVLGVITSWAFLGSYLSTPRSDVQLRSWQLFAYFFAFSLTLFSRIDSALMVAVSSLFIFAIWRLPNRRFQKTTIVKGLSFVVFVIVLIRLVPQLRSATSIAIPPSYSWSQYLLFEIVHIPEFFSDWWGYKVGQQGNGPGVLGIIGLGLYLVCISFALQKSDLRQRVTVSAFSVMLFIIFLRSTIAIGGIVPAAGAYSLGLAAPLLGISIISSRSTFQFMSSTGNRKTVIALLSGAHAISFYAWMEFYTKRGKGIGFYDNLSLNGTWWWDTWISPNFVFISGALLFPVFLTQAWKTITLELPE
jgi:hypothetical protein